MVRCVGTVLFAWRGRRFARTSSNTCPNLISQDTLLGADETRHNGRAKLEELG